MHGLGISAQTKSRALTRKRQDEALDNSGFETKILETETFRWEI